MMSDTNMIINSTMTYGRLEYESVYTYSDSIHLSELHNHQFYEIYIHLNGGRSIYVDSQFYNLVPGSLMIFRPFQLHGIIDSAPLINYERAFLYITPELLRSLGFNMVSFETIIADNLKSGYQYHLDDASRRRCTELLKHISANSCFTSAEKKLEDYSCIIQFLLIITRTICDQNNCESPAAMNIFIKDILSYINSNLTAPLSLDKLAGHFNVSKSALCHQFKKYMNISIYQYLTYRRVTYAKELLAQNMPPSDVAFQCGYGNYSNFLRSFTKLTGCSPREFRKRLGVYNLV